MLATSATSAAETTNGELSCAKCLATFESKDAKRKHMKDDWHVYNLRRHIASLPPISNSTFEAHFRKPNARHDITAITGPYPESLMPESIPFESQSSTPTSEQLFSSNDDSPMQGEHNLGKLANDTGYFNPLQCLFCNLQFESLDSNLSHMSHTHSFFIPDLDYIIDQSSLLSYLNFVISSLHECLLCGHVKSTKSAVQDHMRSKGHCQVDFEGETHQLWQFYDYGGDSDHRDGQDGATASGIILVPDEEELRLPSGKVLGHRSARSHAYQTRASVAGSELTAYHDTEQQLPANINSGGTGSKSFDLQVVRKTSTSNWMIGVSELQYRTLTATTRKIEKTVSRARNEYLSKVESGGNKQKRFRVLGIGKKMGGLEKRLG